jgi:hypothetical protein
MFKRALGLAVWPALISLLVTFARFFGERANIPNAVTFVLGIIWLTFIVSIYWGIKLANDEQPYRLLFLSLAIFALLSRIPVLALWWVTDTWGLGTHYDFTDSFGQALLAQLFGTLTQIVPGTILGWATLALKRRKTPDPA